MGQRREAAGYLVRAFAEQGVRGGRDVGSAVSTVGQEVGDTVSKIGKRFNDWRSGEQNN